MINLMTYQEAIKLCKLFEIYKPTKEPELIDAAHKHKIYKVTTPGNKYAFKEFNLPPENIESQIELINRGQFIASKFQEFKVDSICGISEHGSYLMENEGRYYLIYPWTEGFVVDTDHIATPTQVEYIGNLLARLHKAKIKIKGVKKVEFTLLDYSKWVELKTEFIDNTIISNFIDNLKNILEKINTSFEKSLQSQVISHRNINKSNLIWQDNGNFCTIGWDWSGYTNPEVELVQVAFDWASDGKETVDPEVFKAIIESYKKIRKLNIESIEELVYASLHDTINWLQAKMEKLVESNDADFVDTETKEIQDVIIVINLRLENINHLNKWF